VDATSIQNVVVGIGEKDKERWRLGKLYYGHKHK